MPRQARLDAPGTLHHVIVRGLERGAIVRDDADRSRQCTGYVRECLRECGLPGGSYEGPRPFPFYEGLPNK
jgi:hypothetical protein